NLRRLWLVKGVDGNRRLAVEGLTRTLAAARLSRDPRAGEFRCRFVAYFFRRTTGYSEPTAENFDELEYEKDNLLRAVEVAFNSFDWESVMKMAHILTHPTRGVLVVHGYWNISVSLCEQGLKAATEIDEKWFIGALANSLGSILSSMGNLAKARKYYEQAIAIANQLNEDQGKAATLHELGRLAQAQGEFEEARRLYNESLDIEKRLGNQSGVATTLHQLAMLAQGQGELEEARRLDDESLKIKKKLGYQNGVATTLHQLGNLAANEGDKEEA